MASYVIQTMKDELTCTLCCNSTDLRLIPDCQHSYCIDCISRWRATTTNRAGMFKCPGCRTLVREPEGGFQPFRMASTFRGHLTELEKLSVLSSEPVSPQYFCDQLNHKEEKRALEVYCPPCDSLMCCYCSVYGKCRARGEEKHFTVKPEDQCEQAKSRIARKIVDVKSNLAVRERMRNQTAREIANFMKKLADLNAQQDKLDKQIKEHRDLISHLESPPEHPIDIIQRSIKFCSDIPMPVDTFDTPPTQLDSTPVVHLDIQLSYKVHVGKANSVALRSNVSLYTSTSGDGIHKFDLTNGQVQQIESTGVYTGIAVSGNELYAVKLFFKQVEVYDINSDKIIRFIKLPDSVHYKGLCVTDRHLILVCDYSNSCIRMCYPTHYIINSDIRHHQLSKPEDIAATDQGFVVSCDGKCLLHMSLSGEVLWSSDGIKSPYGVCVRDKNIIYVCDKDNANILMLKSEGKLLCGKKPGYISVQDGVLAIKYFECDDIFLFKMCKN